MSKGIDRRRFLRGCSLAVAATAAGCATVDGTEHEARGTEVTDPFLGTQGDSFQVGFPCLQAPAETTMGVSWRVSGLAKGVVELAENPDFRDSRIVKSGGRGLVPIDVSALQVRLEGLKPGTRYWYRTITTPFTDYKNIYDAKLGEPIVSGG